MPVTPMMMPRPCSSSSRKLRSFFKSHNFFIMEKWLLRSDGRYDTLFCALLPLLVIFCGWTWIHGMRQRHKIMWVTCLLLLGPFMYKNQQKAQTFFGGVYFGWMILNDSNLQQSVPILTDWLSDYCLMTSRGSIKLKKTQDDTENSLGETLIQCGFLLQTSPFSINLKHSHLWIMSS